MNFQNTTFLKSASRLSECPPDHGVEIAFAGRSNAGKSSLLNTLCQQKKLARVSKTPGRTQLLNFFEVDDSPLRRLVDLPGYGYAKVSQQKREAWQQMLSDYLYERKTLQAIVLIVDCRHPLQPFDEQMLDWVINSQMRTHLVFTKMDKLKFGAAKQALFKLSKPVEVYPFISSQLFSSLNGYGLDALKAVLCDVFSGGMAN